MGKPASGPVVTCTVSPPPRLLVSAGPASSCLWSWQLVMGLEEEMVFASLSGEVFLYRAVPWPQRRAGLFRTVGCSSFLLSLETLEFPRVHFFPGSPSLDFSGRGWGDQLQGHKMSIDHSVGCSTLSSPKISVISLNCLVLLSSPERKVRPRPAAPLM